MFSTRWSSLQIFWTFLPPTELSAPSGIILQNYVKEVSGTSFSGGQQRRVSFAISLLHNPELIILDEPTVGVDPMLRQNIWKHLLHLSRVNNKTIIITTHYIEEARQANRVGFMRAGRLLAEERPSALLTKYSVDTLESVFLRLCMTDSNQDKDNWQINTSKPFYEPVLDPHILQHSKQQQQQQHTWGGDTSWGPSLINLWALLIKNILKLKRNLPMLLFIFLLPAVQVVFFCVAIGQEPTGLRLGLVNQELQGDGLDQCPVVLGDCNYNSLGCRVFGDGDDTVELVEYKSEGEGLAAVEAGKLWGVIVIQANFSRLFTENLLSPAHGTEKSASAGLVRVRLDMSNQQVGITLHQWVLTAMNNFTTSLLDGCGHQSGGTTGLLDFQEPVYGEKVLSVFKLEHQKLLSSGSKLYRVHGTRDHHPHHILPGSCSYWGSIHHRESKWPAGQVLDCRCQT